MCTSTHWYECNEMKLRENCGTENVLNCQAPQVQTPFQWEKKKEYSMCVKNSFFVGWMKSWLDICVFGALVYDHCRNYTRTFTHSLAETWHGWHTSNDGKIKDKFKSLITMNNDNDNTADMKAACGSDSNACIYSAENTTIIHTQPVWNAVIMMLK